MTTTSQISTLNLITKCTIFEFMRYFFCDPDKYALLTDKAKQAHCFMFYRLMSIKYPVQMNAISNVHDTRIIDVLHSTFGRKGQQYPGWLYQKQDKSEKVEKTLLDIITKDDIDKIYEVYDLEYKSLLLLFHLDPDKINELIESVKPDDNKVTKTKVKKK